jgi:hypothetical protein
MLETNPYWMDHLRRFPQVALDAPELPGRKYRTCVHHIEGCSAYRDGKVDEARCDCGCLVTKHLEPMGKGD